MTRRSLLIIVTAISIFSSAWGKDPLTKYELANGMTKRATLRLADRYYAESSFYAAADNYKLYLNKKPNDRYATYWLGMALYQARDYKGSEAAFASYYAMQPGPKDNKKKWETQEREYFKQGRLYYGMALHRNGKYDEAQQQLSKFKMEYYTNDQVQQAALIKLANLEMKGCDTANVVGKLKIRIKALPAGINTAYTQSAPFLFDSNNLYYTSLDENNLIKYTDTKNKKYTSIYHATKNGKIWNKGTKMPAVVNEDKYFTGNGTFNPDRSRFYFTKCVEMDDDRSLCNIFVSDVKNGQLTGDITRLPEGINFMEKYTSTQPTVRKVDAYRDIIYYATNREGGKGGLDIWYTQRNGIGLFSAPKPLSNVNTVGDEVTPYFDDSTRTLYFSSDGLPGLGGFDVFSTTLGDEGSSSWSEPHNMGKPLNTGADELYYTVEKNQTFGYFTSNREGSIPLDGISTASDDIYYWENLHFAVDGEITKKGSPTVALPGSRFNLYTTQPDGTLKLIAVDSTTKTGKYFFNLAPDKDYVVEADKPGFLPQRDTITTKGLDDEDTLTANMKVAKDGFVVYGKIKEDTLNEPGIWNADILIYEIKGGREYLFREIMARDTMYATTLPTEKEYKILARKEGYFAGNARISTVHLSPSIDSIRADIKLKKVVINKTYKLSNILYEFDKATLTPTAMLVLDTLYDLLRENPTFVIDLSSHTDGKGADAYNLKLSQARAESCVTYLIKKGISKNRMVPIGYGMRKPVAPNTNPDGSDNPEGRALNRRTEFKITKI
jgi:outer membrane protein OmpA-like peptidoglycan-associated protein